MLHFNILCMILLSSSMQAIDLPKKDNSIVAKVALSNLNTKPAEQKSTEELSAAHLYDKVFGENAWDHLDSEIKKTILLTASNAHEGMMAGIKQAILAYICTKINTETFDANSITKYKQIIDLYNEEDFSSKTYEAIKTYLSNLKQKSKN